MHGKRRLARQQLEKTIASNGNELGPGKRRGTGGPGLAIQQADFSEYIAGTHDVEKDFPTACPAGADPHSATDDATQRISGIAAHEYNRTLLVGPADCQCRDPF